MFIIFGLGNPGKRYENTRHNFGFLLADEIIATYQMQAQRVKFEEQIFVGTISDKKIMLVKPQDYMNNSGSTILSISKFYKIPSNNIIVLHDDLDLELGRIKVKIGGGNGGHNGLKDIDSKIGQNYYRIRLGIGRPENINYEISDYVLSKFNNKELQEVKKINHKICKNFHLVLEDNLLEFIDNTKSHL